MRKKDLAVKVLSFRRVADANEARVMLKWLGKVFIVAGFGVFTGEVIVNRQIVFGNGLFLMLLAYAVHRSQSRVCAALIMILGFLFFLSSLAAFHFFNIIVQGFFSYAAVRTLQIAVIYHRMIGSKVIIEHVLIKGLIASCFLLVPFMFVAALAGMGHPELLDFVQKNESFKKTYELCSIFVPALVFLGWFPGLKNKPLCRTENIE